MRNTAPDKVEVQAPDKLFADKIEALAGYDLSSPDIALVLALDETELLSVYQRELEAGAIKANLRVAESLYRQALGDGRQAVTAAIFWLKTRARWKEVPRTFGPGHRGAARGHCTVCRNRGHRAVG